jgi:hypothetical protein
MEKTMWTIINAVTNGFSPSDSEPIDEIIELGRKALRERRYSELALDLLALDGVRLPLK